MKIWATFSCRERLSRMEFRGGGASAHPRVGRIKLALMIRRYAKQMHKLGMNLIVLIKASYEFCLFASQNVDIENVMALPTVLVTQIYRRR